MKRFKPLRRKSSFRSEPGGDRAAPLWLRQRAGNTSPMPGPAFSPAAAPFTFSNTGSLNTARTVHTATLLPNGKVLVAGGQGASGGNFLSSAELYDPASGSWTTTGSLNTARADHTATLLPNGKVLVAGGYNGGPELTSAELYDPASGTGRHGQPQHRAP